jgi:hypothetical protein
VKRFGDLKKVVFEFFTVVWERFVLFDNSFLLLLNFSNQSNLKPMPLKDWQLGIFSFIKIYQLIFLA